MSLRIDTQARIEAVRLQNQGAAPSAPSAGYSLVFSKSDGLYLETSGGAVIGPFITGSASQAAGTPINGWVSDSNSWAYASADAPSFVASVNATGTMSVGMKVKLTQTSDKYFFITGISVTGTTSFLSLYGGTDYTLVNAAITSPYYSTAKAPLGFPMDPAKWTVSVTDTTSRSQGSPTQNTWYNLASISISIPIGAWFVSYQLAVGVDRGGAGNVNVFSTLSTANNSESDKTMTGGIYATGATYAEGMVVRARYLTLASKTSYYLNERTTLADQVTLYNDGGVATTVISALCAHL